MLDIVLFIALVFNIFYLKNSMFNNLSFYIFIKITQFLKRSDYLYSINSVEDLQELNPYIIVGCGGGGEKFSNLEGIETVGFLDDNPAKQGKPFCGLEVASNLSDIF